MKNILVCGGAGYIGSHMAKYLAESGHDVTVLDNFSTGHRAAAKWGKLVEADLLDQASLRNVFSGCTYDAVMHFCALSLVGDSVREPLAYYRNNVGGTLNLLHAMKQAGVDKLVFSSTAAVYGMPDTSPIDESMPVQPINPYGASKVMVEKILMDAATAYGLRSVSLRYFNAAGADPSGEIGESHDPETHLIPNLMRAALEGSKVSIFGNDYATRDGTCIRDYCHVNDLVKAHLLALKHIETNLGAHCFNLGCDTGSTVLEVVDAVARITGRKIDMTLGKRREGDPPMLVASSALARKTLGWQTEFSTIQAIIETAWQWHQNRSY